MKGMFLIITPAIFLSIFLSIGRVLSLQSVVAPPKIAIIGSGAGGSSAAYHLCELLNNNVDIDVYEATSVVGGRLATVRVLGNDYESGGSILHPKNKLASELVESLGLEKLRSGSSSGSFSLLANDEIIFSSSSWSLISIIKVLWRYGFNLNKLNTQTEEFIGKFSNIYTLQDNGIAFENLESMLKTMDPKLLQLTTIQNFQEFLRKRDYSEIFIKELVEAILYVNYGQSGRSLHGLVGSVGVAGAGNGLWSVQGGNNKLPMKLLNNTQTNQAIKVILNTKIQSIVLLPSETSFKLGLDPNGKTTIDKTYDKIILAFPFTTQTPINFVNFPESYNKIWEMDEYKNRKYHRTVATIVAASRVKDEYRAYLDILACTPHWFTSISRIYPVGLYQAERVPVFKIFSAEQLNDTQLNDIFEEIHQIEVFDWLAYPDYETMITPGAGTSSPLPSFILKPNIYHLNSIEWAASAIEMSLISGRNAAIHIASQISGISAHHEKGTTGTGGGEAGVDANNNKETKTEL